MTPERAKQLLPIIIAFAEGKQIQYRSTFFSGNDWVDCVGGETIFNGAGDYRIKPEVVKVHPHRRYLWRALDGDIKMAIHQQSNSLKPEHIEGHSYFVKWLDTAWVETSHECEAA